MEQLVELKIDSEKLFRYINEELDDREREIICKRYGIPDKDGSLCKPMPQREIAQQMGISRLYLSRIEKRALTKLKKRFNEGGGLENARNTSRSPSIILVFSPTYPRGVTPPSQRPLRLADAFFRGDYSDEG